MVDTDAVSFPVSLLLLIFILLNVNSVAVILKYSVTKGDTPSGISSMSMTLIVKV
jgi:uncharacterized integral membrane protein